MTERNFHYSKDGIDHINIYPQANTELGQKLANFTRVTFVHPWFGPFCSMEGFWHYLRIEEKDDKLRSLSGPEAKFYGKRFKTKKLKHFNTLMIDANYHKVIQNPDIREAMKQSVLPFDHYYTTLVGDNVKQIRLSGFDWLVNGYEDIRKHLKEGRKMPELNYEFLLSDDFQK